MPLPGIIPSRVGRALSRHSDAPGYKKRVVKDFINIIRCGGRVKWLGMVDHVRMGPLQVEHGNRHNDGVTKSRLIDEGGQVSLWFGHVHKRNFYEISGADYSVNAISSGCLCPTTPHYAHEGQSTRSGRKWTQGTAIAQFNLNERLVHFENVQFEDVGT